MIFHSRVAQTTILTTGSALALMTAALGDHAQAEGKLDASYTISFARIRVGDIAATGVFGESEYSISARGRAGGIIKVLVDGEASFSTHGTIKDGYPVPTTFTSKMVSGAETSDVTMVLDEGKVKELAATVPPPKSDRVPVTQSNRQGIVDPLTAMLFSAAAAGEGLARDVCRHTLPIFDGQRRYDLKLAKRMDKVTAEKGYAGPVVVCSVSYEPIAGHRPSTPLIKYLSEGREMEMALAPVAGTRLLTPFRMLVESALANLVIEANQFEVTAQPQDASKVADPKAQ